VLDAEWWWWWGGWGSQAYKTRYQASLDDGDAFWANVCLSTQIQTECECVRVSV
jgi:hypothetical protein